MRSIGQQKCKLKTNLLLLLRQVIFLKYNFLSIDMHVHKRTIMYTPIYIKWTIIDTQQPYTDPNVALKLDF